ncbi:ATP synthase F1 subunit epsilon [bacterium]|nr:ATP synthase F1 subunit epsilon [bacterium]
MALSLQLVTPEKQLLDQPVEMVVIPGSMGDMGVMEGHAAVVTTLRSGLVTIYERDVPTDRYFVRGGFAEVGGAICRVLAENAQHLASVKKSDSQMALAEAKVALDLVRTKGGVSQEELERLEQALADAELLDSLVA